MTLSHAFTMKAAIYDSSSPLGIKFTDAQPKPAPKQLSAAELLIHVRAASINPVDYKLGQLPVVGRFLQGRAVGLDFSGDVLEAPAGCSFKQGDRVFGFAKGTLAESILAPIAEISASPAGLTYAQAAALPTVALTALQALRRNGLKPQERLLVIGASGGVGNMGVQIGKALGAVVTGICSGGNAELVRSLGADRIVDYNDQQQMEGLGSSEDTRFDMIFDTVTSAEDTDYEKLLRKKCLNPSTGRYVAINGHAGDFVRGMIRSSLGQRWSPSWLQRRNFDMVLTEHSAEDLNTLSLMVGEGKVKPILHNNATFGFGADGVKAAFELLHSRRAKGKVVIDVDNSNAQAQ